uniref:Uncharacterized protein n=1 Tax=Arundo donax TaxID=35708 RepID=A0A0A9DRE9_ARUDO
METILETYFLGDFFLIVPYGCFFSCTPKSYEWDYRWMTYPSEARYLKHPYDQSLATFRGHSVLRTLIRCYFSPVHSTGQRYIYTGSSDQCVYIYDVVWTLYDVFVLTCVHIPFC